MKIFTVTCEKTEPLFFLDYSANMYSTERPCFIPDCEITCVSFSPKGFSVLTPLVLKW